MYYLKICRPKKEESMLNTLSIKKHIILFKLCKALLSLGTKSCNQNPQAWNCTPGSQSWHNQCMNVAWRQISQSFTLLQWSQQKLYKSRNDYAISCTQHSFFVGWDGGLQRVHKNALLSVSNTCNIKVVHYVTTFLQSMFVNAFHPEFPNWYSLSFLLSLPL